MNRKDIGLAVIGSGRIGTLRARLASKHPSVKFLAVSDININNAKKLAETCGADFYSADNDEVIARPEVNAVIVSTPEGEHVAAVRKALELGKPVMVEKPIALTLADAATMIEAAGHAQKELITTVIQRFVRPLFTDAVPYNATHHDFAWQRRELGRLMSNELPFENSRPTVSPTAVRPPPDFKKTVFGNKVRNALPLPWKMTREGNGVRSLLYFPESAMENWIDDIKALAAYMSSMESEHSQNR